MSIVNQIIDIYRSDEFWWVPEKASKETLSVYIDTLINRRNIFWASDDEKILGLCETWKISYETLGKLVCKQFEPIELTDTTCGGR